MKLQKEVKHSMRAAFAEGTTKNLEAQWKAYLLFCEFYRLKALPTSSDILCLYAQFLCRSFKSVESVKNYISGVKTMHYFLDVEFPAQQLVHLGLLFKGLARKNPHLPNRALPITPQILLDMFSFMDTSKPNDAIIWCAFLFMFFLMARKSNILPNSLADFSSEKQLIRQDVQVFHHSLVVRIKWSKTNQFGSRLLKIPLTAIPGSVLCPVSAYTHMISLCPAKDLDPAFCINNSNKRVVPLLYVQLQHRLKSLIAKTGRDPNLFSSHSFRRGGCSWAFKSGVPTNLIQHHGDWLSDCYKNYLAFDFQTKLSVSSDMATRILESL